MSVYFPTHWPVLKTLLWIEERLMGDWIVPMKEWRLIGIEAIKVGGEAWNDFKVSSMKI